MEKFVTETLTATETLLKTVDNDFNAPVSS